MIFDRFSFLYLANSSWITNPFSSTISRTITPAGANDEKFVWDNIPPSKELVYSPCFSSFQCARLSVPMDWTNLDDNRTVEIAVIRIPATVPITSPTYGGAVVINPGGPGGSGVELALISGPAIQTVLSAGPETAASNTSRHFDIIGFDPRGVGNTTPSFACFPDSMQMTTYQLEEWATGVFDESDAAFATHWAKNRAIARDCSRRSVESGIGEHMTTASVSRDIIEIFERHGEWREQEAKRLLAPSQRGVVRRGLHMQKTMALQEEENIGGVLDRVKYKPGQEKVQYWGFSYGTILGATLSAMFPDRVSRVVLDGVCDSFDYMKGGWLSNLQDTDLQIARFGEYCWLGGPENCDMYHEDGPAVIVENFMAVVEDLKKNPIGVPASEKHTANVATYGDLKNLFWMKTYNPLNNFHNVSKIMKELSQGNGTGLVQTKREKSAVLEKGLSEQCSTDGPYSKACFNATGGFDILTAAGILCTDADGQTNMTKEAYWEYVEELMGQSTLMGDVWAGIRLPCTQWQARPKWRYEGNFTAKTAEPVLFVSNTVDNVTPIRNAVKMSKGFEGSVILQQDSEGHCSSASPSFCTARTLREYFQTGKLPEKGTVCLPARLPLDGFSEEDKPMIPEGQSDEELWRAMVKLNRH